MNKRKALFQIKHEFSNKLVLLEFQRRCEQPSGASGDGWRPVANAFYGSDLKAWWQKRSLEVLLRRPDGCAEAISPGVGSERAVSWRDTIRWPSHGESR